MEQLASKTLVMIVGPSGVGKSTIMHAATRLSAEFAYVRSFTTRPQRSPSDNTYDFLTRREVEALQARGEVLMSFEHPTTRDLYGETAASYPATYNLLDTMSGSVAPHRTLPFERTITISLTAPAELWRQRFLGRYPEPNDEAAKRLAEARQSIAWSLVQTHDHHWLVNDAAPEVIARKLIDITQGEPGDDGVQIAKTCLSSIDTLY